MSTNKAKKPKKEYEAQPSPPPKKQGILFPFFMLVISTLALAFVTLNKYHTTQDPEIHWDWSKINTDDIFYPKDFIWGTATAAHQVEGYNFNNNWFLWEKTPGKIKTGENAGRSSDQLHLYEKDIQLMKNELHLQSYRFSIEWSRIEPKEGEYNETAIQHYHNVIQTLLSNDMIPQVTLHHFSEPIWFYEKGGFEKEENIKLFVRFAKRMYEEYGKHVKMWCTINEPMVFSLVGFMVGEFPPGKKDLIAALTVMHNLLRAHVEVYHLFKSLPGGNDTMIGMALNLLQYDPANSWNPLDKVGAYIMNRVYKDALLEYFVTGIFKVSYPFVINFTFPINEKAINAHDYVGVNYYQHYHIAFTPFLRFGVPFDLVNKTQGYNFTDMNWNIYPEGLYRAVMLVHRLYPNKPIYITENGIADAVDTRRDLFIRRYLYSLNQAMKDGANVKGFYYWSFVDNFEWAEGFRPRFGLYHCDYDTLERTLYKGSQYFVDVVKKFSKAK